MCDRLAQAPALARVVQHGAVRRGTPAALQSLSEILVLAAGPKLAHDFQHARRAVTRGDLQATQFPFSTAGSSAVVIAAHFGSHEPEIGLFKSCCAKRWPRGSRAASEQTADEAGGTTIGAARTEFFVHSLPFVEVLAEQHVLMRETLRWTRDSANTVELDAMLQQCVASAFHRAGDGSQADNAFDAARASSKIETAQTSPTSSSSEGRWTLIDDKPPRCTLRVRSEHPYRPATDTYDSFCIPGASQLVVAFDPRTATEADCDIVSLYADGAFGELALTHSGPFQASRTTGIDLGQHFRCGL